MQQFTLIHDGSDQAWQAAYLAFHIATRLGAPLVVLLSDSTSDRRSLLQSAAQVEVGGRAAGVAIRTRIIKDFHPKTVAALSKNSNGVFIPHRLIPNESTARRFLETISCPLWIVSKGSEIHETAILVNDYRVDEQLISDTVALAQRTKLSLTGIIRDEEPSMRSIPWISLADFSRDKISAALDQHDINLLFVPASTLSIVSDLTINYVVYPALKNV